MLCDTLERCSEVGGRTCMKVKSQSEVAQSCPTLSNLMDCSLLGSSIHGIFQARILEWVAILFFRVQKFPEDAFLPLVK